MSEMKESMEREIAEAIRLMKKADTALSRLFNTDEGEGEND
jgi:hypothetical protein